MSHDFLPKRSLYATIDDWDSSTQLMCAPGEAAIITVNQPDRIPLHIATAYPMDIFKLRSMILYHYLHQHQTALSFKQTAGSFIPAVAVKLCFFPSCFFLRASSITLGVFRARWGPGWVHAKMVRKEKLTCSFKTGLDMGVGNELMRRSH